MSNRTHWQANTFRLPLTKDAQAQVENGNKAAGARARKVSLEIEKLLKQFRKESIAAGK